MLTAPVRLPVSENLASPWRYKFGFVVSGPGTPLTFGSFIGDMPHPFSNDDDDRAVRRAICQRMGIRDHERITIIAVSPLAVPNPDPKTL